MSTSALEALGSRPLPFLRSSWPWRALAYLLAGAVFCVVPLVVAALSEVLPGWGAVGAGIVALVAFGPFVARFERWRMRLVDLSPVPGTRERRREIGLAVLTLVAFWWIDLAIVGVAVGGPLLLVLSPVVQPEAAGAIAVAASFVGIALVPVGAYVLTAWAGARAAMVRAVLAPERAELEEVRRSRARLVDAFEVERRRIERDLHDGAQQRLVALTMTLGLARLDVPDEAPLARTLDRAHGEAKQVLAELRELIRGVHSQVLTDRGLAAALGELAARSAVPVTIETDLDVRLPPPVEIAAFYVAGEALTNATKHSSATNITIKVEKSRESLLITVTDDGHGGADPAAGTGLTGLADRLDVVGGRLTLSSPPGGPTTIRAEIPCA
ncbi:sensor histidine kinase [Nonomuraea endophytica]|uniref:histidine kinase n=1 Tax=Nonomuraea endophytica TaxID=714136 RepID=A0A7W7ZY36_9ACTN|nr:histidine kinase [Nonomuraea endophytica]MBB5075914.1 signal transduction histidine kinase [Nonomuraea endophytica]